MRKRILAWILIAALLCGQMPSQVFAQGTQTGMKNDILMKGQTSFGNILANTLSTEVEEQEENNGCNIFEVEMQENTAIVSFESVQDATLVIGIYDETGTELLTSGSLEILAGETMAAVEFEAGSIPQYFYIKGYLIEEMTYRPLCTVYESPMYTQEMQEFLSKTVDDFDEELVLNLDEDEANNFAVFSESTILISNDSEQNQVVSIDETSNTYVIENADSSITSLQEGDVFAYPYQENDVLIAKVANVEVNGTTVTITGADTSMEEVFDYIKIDTEMGSGEATVDASSCDDGVTYEGLVDYVEEGTPETYGLESEGKVEKAFKMKLDKEFGNIDGMTVSISGGLEFKVDFSTKVYLTLKMQYVELKFDYSAKASVNITGKASAEIPIVTVGFMVTGVIIELTPSVVLETSGTIGLEGTLSGVVGFRADAEKGITNLTSTPKFKSALKVEGTIFFGISLCPRVKILSDKVASASLNGKVGAELKASNANPYEGNKNKKHTCMACITGEINGKFNIMAELKFLNSIKFTITPVDWKFKIFDFYYSADYDEFAFSTCPHYLLRGEILVWKSDLQSIPNVQIEGKDGTYTTDNEGKAEVWLSKGNHIFSIKKDEFSTVMRSLTLKEGGESLMVILKKKENDNGGTGSGGSEDVGGGDSGEGDDIESGEEVVLSKEIFKVSLGTFYSAALAQDGDLYLWGNNDYGQIGDGTLNNIFVPQKIMSDIKEVDISWSHSAAITEAGDLYLWGWNYYGQIGDGTKENSLIPKKIMSNVKAVSLGMDHSAAITEVGDLYLWGENSWGAIGDGTVQNESLIPQKISKRTIARTL